MEDKSKILVFDDSQDMAESVGLMLARAGFHCRVGRDPTKAMNLIAENSPDLIIAGLRMSGVNGMDLLDLVKQEYPSLPMIIVTGYATVDAAVEAMKKGAADFVSKPFHADELIVKIRKALDLARVLDENRYLRQELQGVSAFPNIIGNSGVIRKILDTLERLKDSECRVLVTGESGTGKEVVSRAIHRLSPRRDEKFFAVNCAALTETLLESELFGHEKGAFTGAITTKIGLFELANHGTLYLDEIADTSQAFQAKLLRAVEQNEFQRVGSAKTIKTDVRIIACTNKNLDKEITKGTFRQDLYYRLCVVHIHLPSLRERKEDIPILTDHFVKKISLKMGKKFEGVSKKAMDLLMAYNWPGNIREMENALERGMIMASGAVIDAQDLPLRNVGEKEDGQLTTLEDLEKTLIERTLIECNWNKSLAAKRIGIGRRTLYDKAVRLGIPLKPNDD
jgi:two-component system response regulator AtoC